MPKSPLDDDPHRERGRRALLAAERAIRADPTHPEPWIEAGVVARRFERNEEALTFLRTAVELAPDDVRARVELGLQLVHDRDPQAAGEVFRRALALDPHHPDAVATYADFLLRDRQTDAAHALLAPVATRVTHPLVAFVWGAVCRKRRRPAEALAPLQRATARHPRAAAPWFALGDVWDALGEHDKAFSAYARGNLLAETRFDADLHRQAVDRMLTELTADRFAAWPTSGLDDDSAVLVCAVPRSGTTLLEQILDAHPDVAGAGERPELHRLAKLLNQRSPSGAWFRPPQPWSPDQLAPLARFYVERLRQEAGAARRRVDKMPDNTLHLGLLALLLPRARVVHPVRDPVDVGWSIFRQHFHVGLAWTRDLATIGTVVATERRVAAHWREHLPLAWHDLDYAALTRDPEPVLRALLAFLDLPWDPAVLAFHDRGLQRVATASSHQTTEPLNSRSVGRARPYLRHLAPMLDALEAGGALAESALAPA